MLANWYTCYTSPLCCGLCLSSPCEMQMGTNIAISIVSGDVGNHRLDVHEIYVRKRRWAVMPRMFNEVWILFLGVLQIKHVVYKYCVILCIFILQYNFSANISQKWKWILNEKLSSAFLWIFVLKSVDDEYITSMKYLSIFTISDGSSSDITGHVETINTKMLKKHQYLPQINSEFSAWRQSLKLQKIPLYSTLLSMIFHLDQMWLLN